MHVLLNILVGVQMLSALVMIGLVLVQHGKGADMGASFGSGSAGSLFGATGSANFLSRMTAVCAAVFFICTLGLAYFSNYRGGVEGPGVLDRPSIAAPGASAPAGASAPLGAAQIPGVAPSPAASPAPAAAPTASAPAAVVNPTVAPAMTATPPAAGVASSAAAGTSPTASGVTAIPSR